MNRVIIAGPEMTLCSSPRNTAAVAFAVGFPYALDHAGCDFPLSSASPSRRG
ncbi:MAG: hypothetical protein ACLSHC_12420 [Bilophila wadsworthia]